MVSRLFPFCLWAMLVSNPFSCSVSLLFHLNVPSGPDLSHSPLGECHGTDFHLCESVSVTSTLPQIPCLCLFVITNNTLIHGFHLKVTSPKLILFLPELPCLFLPPSFDSCFSIFLATRLGISPSALSFPSSLPLIINQ